MTETQMNRYEGMFLFPQSGTADLNGCVDQIKSILERNNAQVISVSKWDERRLAYDIKGNKRGVYFLVYFEAAGEGMQKMERDFNLSEQLLRWLIVRADHLTLEQMQATDGQTQIADEAALRSTESAETQPATVVTVTTTTPAVPTTTATDSDTDTATATATEPETEAQTEPIQKTPDDT